MSRGGSQLQMLREVQEIAPKPKDVTPAVKKMKVEGATGESLLCQAPSPLTPC